MLCDILFTTTLKRSIAKFHRNLRKLNTFQINLYHNMTMDQQTQDQAKNDLKDIFFAGVKAVSPKEIIKSKVKVNDEILRVDDKSFPLREKVYLVGFGKAVMGMAVALENMLGDRLQKGIISIPKLSKDAIWESEEKSTFPKLGDRKIEYREGGVDNYPDNRSLETTHEIMDLVEPLTEHDTLIVLVSGGGSALLYMPRPLINPEDKLRICKLLQNAGADITELNQVRQKLSLVKGGGLARAAYPASVIGFILSDIINDPIHLIASGPTVYSTKAPEEILPILRKYDLYKSLEGDLKLVLCSKESFDDGPLLNDLKEFKHVNNLIIANNMTAIKGANAEVLRKRLTPIIVRNDIKGNVHDVSLAYVHLTSLMCLVIDKDLEREEFLERVQENNIISLPASKVDEIYNCTENVNEGGVVLIAGGEPTVKVTGQGKGGRNQELALYFSLDWLAKIKSNPRFAEYDVVMLSGGTDGQDGPTDAAGAFGYPAIGPIIHDLYAELKSMVAREMERVETDESKDESSTSDMCKARFLSNSTTMNDVSTKVDSTEILKREQHDLDNKDKAQQSINTLILMMMEVERMLPENSLRENDSNNFFSRFYRGRDLLKTGFTGTNVMDLHLIYIKKRKCMCDITLTTEGQRKNILEQHDLHIDASTMQKFAAMRKPLRFQRDADSHEPFLSDEVSETKERLNVTILDENVIDPCCNRKQKS